ncbi:MAG: hypothetical protein DCC65_16060 [Planctomycetota bacterium]|nr:MAG: hypothetical protein DCC65_16060 [Planctomycetota bacterium]
MSFRTRSSGIAPARRGASRIARAGALAALVLSSGAAIRPSVDVQCASLRLENRTDRPIYVYLDGRFITCCESGMQAVVECARQGDFIGVGRFRCETWGPRRLTLKAGVMTEWILSEETARPR